MSRFEATCACPRCGLVATHKLRAPDPKRDGSPRRIDHGNGEYTEIRVWGGQMDERKYEAIRTCSGCGKIWGQK